MEYITNADLNLVLYRNLELSIKIEILDEQQKLLDTIYANLLSGTFHINSSDSVRRTCVLSLMPDIKKGISLEPDSYFGLDKSIRVLIGVKGAADEYHKWYSQGMFYLKDTSSNYDAVTNTLQLSCEDYITKLNGVKNGAIGVLQTVIPSYVGDPETGEPIKHNTIREAMVGVLENMAGIKKHRIDDIGKYMGIQQYNDDWQNYRKANPLWNTIPYDLTFAAGCSIFSILEALRDLYPNYEMFFDTDGTLICRMIPSLYEDDLTLDNEYIQKILISEDVSTDITTVRNICEVWGNVLEADYFSEECSYGNRTYQCKNDTLEKYVYKKQLGVTIPADNEGECYLKVNSLDKIPIYDTSTGAFLPTGKLQSGETYVFRFDWLEVDQKKQTIAYFLGQWQPHALDVLVDGTVSREKYQTQAGLTVAKYSEEYFKDKYQCNSVSLTITPDSPFTVQKIGEIPDVKIGGEYDKIYSEAEARDAAIYENWRSCRLTDSITITTKLIPFLDVNLKCSYRRSDQRITRQYIIKSLSHDLDSGTSTWNMMRFYPQYNKSDKDMGTHKTLGEYDHRILGLYTHKQLQQLKGRNHY